MMKLDLLRGRHGCLLSFRTFACILFAQDFVESNTRAPYASTHRAAGGQLDGRVAARGGLSVLNGERQAAAPWHGAGQLLLLGLPLLQSLAARVSLLLGHPLKLTRNSPAP